LVYLACILLSLTFFDASTRLDNRILAPVYVAFLCALFTMLGSLSVRWQWVGGVIATLLILMNITATISTLSDFFWNGKGFTGKNWKESQAVAYVRENADDSIIYSNQGLVLHFLTGKPIYEIPEKMDVVMNMERPNYNAELGLMKDRLNNPNAFVVWFIPSALPDSVLTELNVPLKEHKTFPDAILYAAAKGTLP
jgi:hypothetical protein